MYYRSRVLDTFFAYSCDLDGKAALLSPDLGRGLVTMTPHDRGLVIDPPKLLESDPQLLSRRNSPHPEEMLLEDENKSLRTTIPLRFPHIDRRRGDSQASAFFLKQVRHTSTSVVMTPGKLWGHIFPQASKAFPHPLTPKPGLHLSVTFFVKSSIGKDSSDVLQKLLVRIGTCRTRSSLQLWSWANLPVMSSPHHSPYPLALPIFHLPLPMPTGHYRFRLSQRGGAYPGTTYKSCLPASRNGPAP